MLNYQNATRNDRQIETRRGRVGILRAKGRTRRERGNGGDGRDELTSENYESS